MADTFFPSLQPDIQAAAQALPGGNAWVADADRRYRGVRLFSGGEELNEQILYLIRKGDVFPTDRYAYLCTEPIEGRANHVSFPGCSETEVLNGVMALFADLWDKQMQLDRLLQEGESLDALCRLGESLLDNPVYIHDDWFMVLAQSEGMSRWMRSESLNHSNKRFVPKAFVDAMKDDPEYLQTFTKHRAELWIHDRASERSIYVNLWEGSLFRGRLLVGHARRDFTHLDFLIAEVLAQIAVQMLRRRQLGEHRQERSLDNILYDLLQGKEPDAAELTQMMNLLDWGRSDEYLCVRIQSQSPVNTAIEEHALHSDLFLCFPNSYIMLSGGQQCIVVNLTRSGQLPRDVRRIISPLCRDYCLYAGYSMPVSGVQQLRLAGYQAQIALDQAFRMRNEKWILAFSECALDYLLGHLESPLRQWDLVSPDLRILQRIDAQKGSAYYQTLREYLLQERDIPRTAQALIIHRTTLLYRLKKMRTILSANLDDPWERLYLLLSIRILEKN